MSFFTEYIALDIGTCSLNFFSLDPGPAGQGFALHSFSRHFLPPGLVFGGFTNPNISSVPDFTAILKQQLTQLPSRKNGLIIGLPDRWVKLHLVETVFRPEEAASPDYIRWRLRKMLCPPNVGEILVDHQILGQEQTDEGTSFQLVVGMVKKDVVDLLSNIFVNLHVQVMAFDTSTLGVYNLFENFFPDRSLDRNVIFCHVGHETTVVKVFHHGILKYERVIEVGGEAFGRLYAQIEGLPPEDGVEKVLHRPFFPLTRRDILDLIEHKQMFEQIFGNWLRELQVTFRFYQDKFQVQQLPNIYLTGGASLFAGLPEFLGDFFEVPCQRFNPLAKLPCGNEIDAVTMEQGPQMAPAIGLLLK